MSDKTAPPPKKAEPGRPREPRRDETPDEYRERLDSANGGGN